MTTTTAAATGLTHKLLWAMRNKLGGHDDKAV